MDKEFEKSLKSKSMEIGITLKDEQIKDFYNYMENLLKWNEKINLTSIVKKEDIIDKHFIDSLTVVKYINKGDNIIDVGTGAGFPGIPVSIAVENVNVTLLDSLNKRINFLEYSLRLLKLASNVKAVHSRAEEYAIKLENREMYDLVVSRAVANMRTLLEYMLPFCKVGGICLCMKGSNVNEEIELSKKALKILGGKIEKIENIILPGTDYERNIIVVRKIKNTPKQYPRKLGKPSKEPL